MNVKRFTGRNSREAMQNVKAALGDEAIVLSTKPAAEGGIEILAMGADGIAAVETMSRPAVSRREAQRDPQGQAQREPRQAESDDGAVVASSGRSVSQAVSESVSQLAHSVLMASCLTSSCTLWASCETDSLTACDTLRPLDATTAPSSDSAWRGSRWAWP